MSAPYQMTAADGARARRKAALLRALAGFAARGPEPGTNPIASFQAGLAGSLAMGQQQAATQRAAERSALQDEYMQAQIAHLRAPQRDPLHDEYVRAQIAHLTAHPGDHQYGAMPWYENPAVNPALRDQYRADALYHASPGQGRQSFGEKIAEREHALGRKLTARELNILAGVERNPLLESTQRQYIDQFGNPYYQDERGIPTRQPFGPKGERRAPFMETTQRIYQGQGDPLEGYYGH